MNKKLAINSKKSAGQYWISKLPVIMAFLIPVLILLILYIGRGVFPFGNNMYLRSDMYHQYAPFMKEFQRNLQNGGSLLYSWNIGLGTNFASTYAYYLASPLNWLVALFPETLVPEFMNIMIILKAGLMSSAFAYYLIRKYKKNQYTATVFGCFYAMSSYMAAFSWNLMWLDCLVLLPFILMGLEALVKKGRSRMYVISLAICVISNYYISIMICIFLVFYFIYLMICEGKFTDKYTVVIRICQFILYSLIAGCIGMFIVFPALCNLFITASSNSSFPSRLTAYYNILEMLAKSVINTEPAVFSGHFPNIYCSMALFLLVPLYWLSRKVPAKQKAGKTLLIALLAFSFMFNIPTYIWHGFHFPNSLPCRYSFIYIFLVLTMGYQALINIRKYKAKELVICAAASIAGIFVLQELYSDDFTVANACLGAAFVLLYLMVAAMMKKKTTNRILTTILLLVISVGEIVINTNETGYSITSRTAYYSDNEDIRQMLDEVDDGTFYRTEKVSRRTKNDGAWLDYNSASIFSSTTVAGNSDLYEALGMQGRTNAYSYSGHTPVTQALLGVRYEISDEELTDTLKTEVTGSGDFYLYENKYALSLGYLVNSAVKDTMITVSEPFELQNDLLSNMTGVENVFYTMPSMSGSRALIEAEITGRCMMYVTSDTEQCVVEISRDGEVIDQISFDDMETPQIIDIGDVQEGDLITVMANDGESETITVYPAIMDYEKYDLAMQTLKSGELDISEYTDTYVCGTVNVSENTTLFTTIPYDEGWTIYVDGVETDYEDFDQSFIMIDLTAGEHVVEFRYWPLGLTIGIIISAAALLLFVLLEIIFRKKRCNINELLQ